VTCQEEPVELWSLWSLAASAFVGVAHLTTAEIAAPKRHWSARIRCAFPRRGPDRE
jgi:hypothetical protein